MGKVAQCLSTGLSLWSRAGAIPSVRALIRCRRSGIGRLWSLILVHRLLTLAVLPSSCAVVRRIAIQNSVSRLITVWPGVCRSIILLLAARDGYAGLADAGGAADADLLAPYAVLWAFVEVP